MAEHPYTVGTLVRVCKIAGPKMVVATVHTGGGEKPEYGYDCIWFDKDHHMQNCMFNQRMLERAR